MIKNLISGFKKFKTKYYDINNSEIKKLAKNGQKPDFLIISCSDSRIDPAILFQSKLGKIFSVRNVANIIPPYTVNREENSVGAAIEYGVLNLKIKNIIVLGHSDCGGIKALRNKLNQKTNTKSNPSKDSNVDSWIEIIIPAFVNGDSVNNSKFTQEFCEKESIKNSINNLKNFPWILDLVNKKELNIYGWWYDMHNGDIFSFKENTNNFEKITL